MTDDAQPTPAETPSELHLTVTDAPDEGRFEVRTADGALAGAAYYHRRPGIVVFTHTEVDPAYEGHGVGATLAREALDAVRSAGGKVVPLCPFIAAYIERHAEYEDLVHPE